MAELHAVPNQLNRSAPQDARAVNHMYNCTFHTLKGSTIETLMKVRLGCSSLLHTLPPRHYETWNPNYWGSARKPTSQTLQCPNFDWFGMVGRLINYLHPKKGVPGSLSTTWFADCREIGDDGWPRSKNTHLPIVCTYLKICGSMSHWLPDHVELTASLCKILSAAGGGTNECQHG